MTAILAAPHPLPLLMHRRSSAIDVSLADAECFAGSFSEAGADSCTTCPPHSSSDKGASTCICQAGYIAVGSGQSMTCNRTYPASTRCCISSPVQSTATNNCDCAWLRPASRRLQRAPLARTAMRAITSATRARLAAIAPPRRLRACASPALPCRRTTTTRSTAPRARRAPTARPARRASVRGARISQRAEPVNRH